MNALRSRKKKLYSFCTSNAYQTLLMAGTDISEGGWLVLNDTQNCHLSDHHCITVVLFDCRPSGAPRATEGIREDCWGGGHHTAKLGE